MITVKYRKNIVTGDKKGSSYVDSQVLTNTTQAQAYQRVLMEVTDLFPAKDPVTGELCYVTDIEENISKESA